MAPNLSGLKELLFQHAGMPLLTAREAGFILVNCGFKGSRAYAASYVRGKLRASAFTPEQFGIRSLDYGENRNTCFFPYDEIWHLIEELKAEKKIDLLASPLKSIDDAVQQGWHRSVVGTGEQRRSISYRRESSQNCDPSFENAVRTYEGN